MKTSKEQETPGFFATWGNEILMVLVSIMLMLGGYMVVLYILEDPPVTASAITEPFWTMLRVTIYNAFSWVMAFLYKVRVEKSGNEAPAESWFIWAIVMVSCSLLGF